MPTVAQLKVLEKIVKTFLYGRLVESAKRAEKMAKQAEKLAKQQAKMAEKAALLAVKAAKKAPPVPMSIPKPNPLPPIYTGGHELHQMYNAPQGLLSGLTPESNNSVIHRYKMTDANVTTPLPTANPMVMSTRPNPITQPVENSLTTAAGLGSFHIPNGLPPIIQSARTPTLLHQMGPNPFNNLNDRDDDTHSTDSSNSIDSSDENDDTDDEEDDLDNNTEQIKDTPSLISMLNNQIADSDFNNMNPNIKENNNMFFNSNTKKWESWSNEALQKLHHHACHTIESAALTLKRLSDYTCYLTVLYPNNQEIQNLISSMIEFKNTITQQNGPLMILESYRNGNQQLINNPAYVAATITTMNELNERARSIVSQTGNALNILESEHNKENEPPTVNSKQNPTKHVFHDKDDASLSTTQPYMTQFKQQPTPQQQDQPRALSITDSRHSHGKHLTKRLQVPPTLYSDQKDYILLAQNKILTDIDIKSGRASAVYGFDRPIEATAQIAYAKAHMASALKLGEGPRFMLHNSSDEKLMYHAYRVCFANNIDCVEPPHDHRNHKVYARAFAERENQDASLYTLTNTKRLSLDDAVITKHVTLVYTFNNMTPPASVLTQMNSNQRPY